MTYEQLKGRLQLSSQGPVTNTIANTTANTGHIAPDAPISDNEDCIADSFSDSVGDRVGDGIGLSESAAYYPLDFSLDKIASWRREKDRRQLAKVQMIITLTLTLTPTLTLTLTLTPTLTLTLTLTLAHLESLTLT